MTTNIINSTFNSHPQAEMFLGKEGLPTKKTVGYKFTPLSRMLPESLTFSTDTAEYTPINLWNENCLLFSGGQLLKDKSNIPEKLTITELDKNEFKDQLKNSLQAINLLRANHIYQIEVPKNTIINNLKIEYVSNFSDKSNCDGVCLIIKVGENSKLELFESTKAEGSSPALVNSFTVATVEKNATFNHYTLGNAPEKISLVNNRRISLAESANYKGVYFDGGLGHNRNDLEVILTEKFAHAELLGLYALKEKQFSDNFINVHHQAADSTSNQLFKGILKDQARAVFTGKVLVDAGANQVNSSQLNKNILLDNTAQVQTEPQLEVYTDDVKCGHGATVGQLSDEEIFYLESRGISKERAFQMLCQAYAEEILMNISCEDLKKHFHDQLYGHFDFSDMAKELIEGKK